MSPECHLSGHSLDLLSLNCEHGNADDLVFSLTEPSRELSGPEIWLVTREMLQDHPTPPLGW